VPIAWVERASLDGGLNFLADTLMYAGALLLIAGAMPRQRREMSSLNTQTRRPDGSERS
jgi:hypothetical protein